MKKVLLLLLALFSLIGLTACGDVKPKEINVDGSKADEEDLLDYMDEYEEYFKENEIDDQWYSIKFHSSVIEDEFKSTLKGIIFSSPQN